MAEMMRAAVFHRYGGPEVVAVEEVPKPVPGDDELLVRVLSTSVNRTNTAFRIPEYRMIIGFMNGFSKPRKQILGGEFCGTIAAVGKSVTDHAVGDCIFGLTPNDFGSHAEYLCIPTGGAFATKPDSISDNDAGAVLDGMHIANTVLRSANLGSGQRLLINGASGSIGSAALQLARIRGLEVLAVGSSKSQALLADLGAERVIDYSAEDFTKCGERFDLVLDAVGKSSIRKCWKLLSPGGIFISSELGFLAQNPFLSLLSCGTKVRFPIPVKRREDIEQFSDYLAAGEYRPVIDRVFELDEVVEAHRYVDTGEKIGNVALRIFPVG